MFFPIDTVWSDVEAKYEDLGAKDWWGARGDLENRGLSFEALYTGEFDSNLSGGRKKDETYLGNLDLTLTADFEKMGLWKGGKFFIYVLDNHGSDKLKNELVGDLQGNSNIDAPRTTKIYELWYEQTLFDDKLSLLFGMHDLNSEFDVTEYGGLFLNGSFGVEADISANFTPSIFPATGLAARVFLKPCDFFDIRAAVYDGDPTDGGSTNHGTRIHLTSAQAALTIVEGAVHYNLPLVYSEEALPGTAKLGGWHHGADFNDKEVVDDQSNAIVHDDNYGVYVVADQMLYREHEDQGLGAFVQWGANPADRNTVDRYLGLGLTYRGLIPDRDEDDFGVSMARAYISDHLRAASGQDNSETTLELTYRAQVTKALVVQPDFQWVSDPNADPALKDAKVFMLRFEIGL